jgi:hypothetical protein
MRGWRLWSKMVLEAIQPRYLYCFCWETRKTNFARGWRSPDRLPVDPPLPSTSITLTKLSQHNLLIKCSQQLSYVLKSSQTNSLDLKLKYLSDLNRYFNQEYRVLPRILTIKNERNVNGKYWLYEYIHVKVYNDCDCEHIWWK